MCSGSNKWLDNYKPPAVLLGAVSILIHCTVQLIETLHLLQGDSPTLNTVARRDAKLACCLDLVLLDVLIEAEMDISCNYSSCRIL